MIHLINSRCPPPLAYLHLTPIVRNLVLIIHYLFILLHYSISVLTCCSTRIVNSYPNRINFINQTQAQLPYSAFCLIAATHWKSPPSQQSLPPTAFKWYFTYLKYNWLLLPHLVSFLRFQESQEFYFN